MAASAPALLRDGRSASGNTGSGTKKDQATFDEVDARRRALADERQPRQDARPGTADVTLSEEEEEFLRMHSFPASSNLNNSRWFYKQRQNTQFTFGKSQAKNENGMNEKDERRSWKRRKANNRISDVSISNITSLFGIILLDDAKWWKYLESFQHLVVHMQNNFVLLVSLPMEEMAWQQWARALSTVRMCTFLVILTNVLVQLTEGFENQNRKKTKNEKWCAEN